MATNWFVVGRRTEQPLRFPLGELLAYALQSWHRNMLYAKRKIVFEKVCTDFGAQLIEMNGEVEHVHLLIHYPPKHSVSSLVNSLKGVSSRLLRLERPDMEKRYWNNVLWSPSYFASSCGGAPLGMLTQYVEQQKTPL